VARRRWAALPLFSSGAEPWQRCCCAPLRRRESAICAAPRPADPTGLMRRLTARGKECDQRRRRSNSWRAIETAWRQKRRGGFATARAAAGVLAVSGHQQKATPDSGKGARPRAERSPRSPIVHRRHLKFGAVSDSAQSPVHHARLGGSGLATGSPPPAPLQPARTGVRIGLSGARSRSPVRTDKEEASGGGTHI
jgi:hypothetical protein